MKNGIRCLVLSAALVAPSLASLPVLAAGDTPSADTGGDMGGTSGTEGKKGKKGGKKKKGAEGAAGTGGSM
jgi:hypothetical protein